MPATAVATAAFTTAAGYSALQIGIALYVAGAIDAYIIGQVLAPKDIGNDLGKQNLNIRSAAETHKIVYGKTMTGGTVVMMDVLDRYYLTQDLTTDVCPAPIIEKRSSGKYLNTAIAIAAHEIDSIDEIWIGEDLVYETDYISGRLKLVKNKYHSYIDAIGYNGSQNEADSFIKANVDRHYLGKDIDEDSIIEYYKYHGVTNVTDSVITFTDTSDVDAYPQALSYDHKVGLSDNVAQCVGDYSNASYTFTKTTKNGRTIPSTGLPWLASHKLTNTSYVYLRFRYNPDLYNGMPKIRVVMKGKKVFDPRKSIINNTFNILGEWTTATAYVIDDVITRNGKQWYCIEAHTSSSVPIGLVSFSLDFVINNYWRQVHDNTDPNTWEWSDNWALCVRDYLTSGNYHSLISLDNTYSLYGVGIKESEINDTNIIEAANIADEIVLLETTPQSVISSSYTSSTNTVSCILGGDQTDYYVKYENLEVTVVDMIRDSNNLAVFKYQTNPNSDYLEQLSNSPIQIIDSFYSSDDDETTVKFKYPDTISPTTLRLYSKRFTVNGIVDTGASPISLLENLLASGAGTLPYVQGKFLVIPGIYQTPNPAATTLTEDLLAGPITVNGSLGSSELVNTVTGTIRNAANKWEETDFPKQTSTTYITEDGGYELVRNVKYGFLSSNFDAERLARISLQRTREGVSFTAVCNLKALEYSVGQFIEVTIDRLGWTDKVFSITSLTVQDNKVILGLREENSLSYDWSSINLTPIKYTPNSEFTVLPDLSPVTKLTLSSGTSDLIILGDGTISPRVRVTWTSPAQDDQTYLELNISIYDPTDLSITRRTELVRNPDEEKFFIEGIKEGQFISVEALIVFDDPNFFLKSTPVSYFNHTVLGKQELPNNIDGFTSTVNEDMIVLSWTKNNELDFKEYEIREGGSNWATATLIDVTTATELIITGETLGNKTFRIKSIDTSTNESAAAVNTVINVSSPSIVSAINNTVLSQNINIFWPEATKGTFTISGYEVKYGGSNWDTATSLVKTASTDYIIPSSWAGDRTFRVRAYDVYGNYGTEQTVIINISVPSAPTLTQAASIIGDRVEFSWAATPGTYSVESYEIRYDSGTGTFADATSILITSTNGFSRKVNWGGTRRFWIAPIDTLGNYGTELTESVVITSPGTITITPQVIDNNVLLSWADPAIGSLPIDYYEIRKGDTYGTSTLIGNISSIFTTFFETVSGIYKYWVTGVDTAGNMGTNNSVTAQVSEPPDYVLLTSYSDDFSGTLSNALVNSNGKLNMPVDLTETWTTHFTDNSWTTIQDQIDDSFPIYIQNTPATGSYQFVYDYGSVLTNLSVTCNVTQVIVDGDPVATITLETSDEVTPTVWTTYTGTTASSLKIFSSSFRHIRVTITVTSSADDDDILEIEDIGLVIDIKEKTDAGIVTATSTDTGAGYTNGTLVTLNKTFVDINSIIVTPNLDSGTEDDFTAIYNFEDVANPTTFRVLLFDGSGTRVTGPVSWIARGY